MKRPRHAPGIRSRAGFTLLEMLLALALIGALMVALNTFIFSMTEIWGRNREPRLFDQHVRAVTRYLEAELRNATLPPAADAQTPALVPRSVRLESGISEDLLTFELPSGSRLFAWPERPLPEVICALSVRRDQGLVLLWRSRLERDFPDDPPRELVLTPFVTELAYEYYDASFKRWEKTPSMKRGTAGAFETPQRIRLTFAFENLRREVAISLPATGQGLPIF